MKAAIHEMRNHLCVAMAGIEAFLDHKLEPSHARLSAVYEALREVGVLIEDLPSDRTVYFATHAIPIDVCRVVESQLIAMEGYAAGRDIRLMISGCSSSHDGAARFLGDPGRIAEIVTNVVINAIRHSPPGGTVSAEYRRDATSLWFCVSDDGPGIALEERERIFERGFRGNSVAALRGSGSGIGLALVKEFVNRQGGNISVTAGPRFGASFTITLPGMHDDESGDDARCSVAGLIDATPVALGW